MTIIGLDVSKWQGQITAATVASMRAHDVQFCWVKLTQGMGYEDPQWRNSVPLLQAGGILVGPYHFVTNNKASNQFNWFNMTMGNFDWDLPPALDCEAYSSQYGLSVGEKIAHDIVHSLAYPSEAIIDVIGRSLTLWMQGKPKMSRYTYPAIYTNSSSGNVIFKTPSMSRYPLWVAHWNAAAPLKPNVWKGVKYLAWQRAVVDGQPYGIDGKVDYDEWGDLVEFLGALIPPPPAQSYIDMTGVAKGQRVSPSPPPSPTRGEGDVRPEVRGLRSYV